MSRDPKELTDLLQTVWKDICSWHKIAFPTREIFLTCTHRSIKEQAELYAKGRTKPGSVITQLDGIKKKSKHNYEPARAFDFAIKDQGRVVWHYKYFVPVVKALKESKYKDKIRCGADFSFKDWPHVEEV